LRWTYTAGWTNSLWRSGRQALAEKGFLYVLRVVPLWATFPLWGLWFRAFPRTFRFRSATYPYFFHNHNLTWSNERAVEVPIVRSLLAEYRGKRILEVGNVLAYYMDLPGGHEVLDKFEVGPAIRNEDVATFRSSTLYDLIVSVSTLEHVGWDEEPKEPGKILRAVANLTDHLAPGGRMLVTLPLGYNPDMDALLARDAIPFSHRYCMKRHGLCRWEEASWEEIAGAPYAEGWPGAQGLVIGVVERSGR
jgi:SAM-dependent methyltransferase